MGKKLFGDKFIGYHTFGLEVDGVNVIVNSVDNNGFEYVDLGLPSGTLWATDDLRKSGTAFGITIKYCQWGTPTSPKVQDMGGIPSSIPDYSSVTVNPALSTSGYVSQNIDVVHNEMGGSWVTPSIEQFIELGQYCTVTHEENSYEVTLTGPNGNSITFQTHGGYIQGSQVQGRPTEQHYLWTSSEDPNAINNIHFAAIIANKGIVSTENSFNDYFGMNLRGVINTKTQSTNPGKENSGKEGSTIAGESGNNNDSDSNPGEGLGK